MVMSQYEQHFAHAGVATLAFDYRHTGAPTVCPGSDSHYAPPPTGRLGPALDYLRGHDSIDSQRVGLWGTSLGAMHVLREAGTRTDFAAVVVQCPIVHGPATFTRSGWRPAVRLMPAILGDVLRRMRGAEPRYVAIVGEPGSCAAVTIAGALDGWYDAVPPGASFDNRMAAADVIGIAVTSAKSRAMKITAPLLVCVSARETLMDPHHAEEVGSTKAPRGVVHHYVTGATFRSNHPPLLAKLLADQTRFLQEHLNVQNS